MALVQALRAPQTVTCKTQKRSPDRQAAREALEAPDWTTLVSDDAGALALAPVSLLHSSWSAPICNLQQAGGRLACCRNAALGRTGVGLLKSLKAARWSDLSLRCVAPHPAPASSKRRSESRSQAPGGPSGQHSQPPISCAVHRRRNADRCGAPPFAAAAAACCTNAAGPTRPPTRRRLDRHRSRGMSGSPSADRLGQALSSYSLRPPAEGAADSEPPPVLQAPTDVSAAGVVLENARLGGVHSVVSEGVASAGLPPQVGPMGCELACTCAAAPAPLCCRAAARAPACLG